MDKKIFKSALVLTIIAVMCGLLLGLTNFLTAPIIEENRVAAARKAYEGFFEDLKTIEITTVEGQYVYEYVKVIGQNNEIIGHAFRAKGTNARGLIDVVIAATAEGAIKGIEILSTDNTPGYYDLYEGSDGYLTGVNGNTLNELTGINNISGATQTGDTLNAMLKEVGEIAINYVQSVVLNQYESLFGLGSVGVVDEAFVGNEIVTEKSEVYDAEENLLGYTYTAAINTTEIPNKDNANLEIVVGFSKDGIIKGVYELVNEHTPRYYKNYEEALLSLSGKDINELEIDSIVGATISGDLLKELFNRIKEFAVEDIPTNYELIFGKDATGVIDEAFVGNEIVTEKSEVYDREENLIGYTYTAEKVADVHDDYAKDKLLKIMLGVNLDGKVVGLVHIENEHTPSYYNKYLDALEAIEGELIENLELDVIVESTRSGNILNELFNRIKEVIANE